GFSRDALLVSRSPHVAEKTSSLKALPAEGPNRRRGFLWLSMRRGFVVGSGFSRDALGHGRKIAPRV
ncbi:hypothetical protein, partial [Dokdonella immobilis]|uniref:hypothetical protein n=1 Tax=Dokdonella immobilis TaxID=578942 RepID=UPI001C31944E